MDISRPYAAVSPSLDGDVLRVLAGTTRVLTGREVAALAGRRSHSGVLDVLRRLTEHGLVNRVELNRAYLFTLNREHLAAPAVEILMGMRAELLRRIRGELDAWKITPVHLAMFGSTARGDGDTRSDVDLLVIRSASVGEDDPQWRVQLDDLSADILRWTGNHMSLVEIDEAQLARLRQEEPPIISQLRADAIVLSGSKLTTLLRLA
jgi:predicted nucleotidyltransferase